RAAAESGSLNHLRAYAHRLFAIASTRSVLVDRPEPRQSRRAAALQEVEAHAGPLARRRGAGAPRCAGPKLAAAVRDGALPRTPARRAHRSAEARRESARRYGDRLSVTRGGHHEGRARRRA